MRPFDDDGNFIKKLNLKCDFKLKWQKIDVDESYFTNRQKNEFAEISSDLFFYFLV